jgi:hypothetical protein
MKTISKLTFLLVQIMAFSANAQSTTPATTSPAKNDSSVSRSFSTALTQEASLPVAGYWQISASMKGGFGSDDPQTKKVCMTEQQLNLGIEKSFMEAVSMKPPGKMRASEPTCQYANIERHKGKLSWTASCDGPFGTMAAQGAGSYSASSFDGEQKVNMRGPMGNMKMTRKVMAKYIGQCPAQ